MAEPFCAEDSRPVRMSIIQSSPAVLMPLKGLRRHIKEIWAIGDQTLISGSNFATMVLVAHGLGNLVDFGRFTLVYSALLFANVLQVALVTQPHNVLGAAREGDNYRRYTTSTLLSHFFLIAIPIL